MKKSTLTNIRTTLCGLLSIAAAIVPVLVPGSEPLCAKLVTIFSGLGLISAADAPRSGAGGGAGAVRGLFLVFTLGGLLFMTCGFRFFSQRNSGASIYWVTLGNPNADQFATNSGIGSIAVDISDTNAPTTWVRVDTSTNGYRLVVSPSSTNFADITVSNLIVTSDVTVGEHLNVNGVTTLGDVSANDVSANAVVGYTLTSTTSLTAASANIENNLDVGANLSVNDSITASGSLVVTADYFSSATTTNLIVVAPGVGITRTLNITNGVVRSVQ